MWTIIFRNDKVYVIKVKWDRCLTSYSPHFHLGFIWRGSDSSLRLHPKDFLSADHTEAQSHRTGCDVLPLSFRVSCDTMAQSSCPLEYEGMLWNNYYWRSNGAVQHLPLIAPWKYTLINIHRLRCEGTPRYLRHHTSSCHLKKSNCVCTSLWLSVSQSFLTSVESGLRRGPEISSGIKHLFISTEGKCFRDSQCQGYSEKIVYFLAVINPSVWMKPSLLVCNRRI